MQTDWIITTLPYLSMIKQYGRVVTADAPVAWPRCPTCHGSGVDRRP
jgi:hypothetical protein